MKEFRKIFHILMLPERNDIRYLQLPMIICMLPEMSGIGLIVPVFDTLRVFITRIFRNVSPFSPDKTHIHHYLLDLGLTHLQATLVLFFTGILFVMVSWFLRDLTVAWLLIWLLLIGAVLWFVPILWVERKRRNGSIIEID